MLSNLNSKDPFGFSLIICLTVCNSELIFGIDLLLMDLNYTNDRNSCVLELVLWKSIIDIIIHYIIMPENLYVEHIAHVYYKSKHMIIIFLYLF